MHFAVVRYRRGMRHRNLILAKLVVTICAATDSVYCKRREKAQSVDSVTDSGFVVDCNPSSCVLRKASVGVPW